MTVFEAGLAIAGGVGETFETMRAMIGTETLALAMAKSFAEAAGITLSPTDVAKAMGVARNTAISAIKNTEFQNSQINPASGAHQ
jgi:predicted sugar kinase